MRFRVPRPVLAGGLALSTSCHDATDVEQQRLIGRIDASNTQVPVIVAPAAVQANAPFTVIVHTTGTSGCTRPDGEALEVRSGMPESYPMTSCRPRDIRMSAGATTCFTSIACQSPFRPRGPLRCA
jgi:hypothetical protein